MATASPNPRERILVLDDEREMGAFLADLLSDEGYVVETYQQGDAVMAALEKGATDLLITDLVMKGMQGMEVLRAALRQMNFSAPVSSLLAYCIMAVILGVEDPEGSPPSLLSLAV